MRLLLTPLQNRTCVIPSFPWHRVEPSHVVSFWITLQELVCEDRTCVWGFYVDDTAIKRVLKYSTSKPRFRIPIQSWSTSTIAFSSSRAILLPPVLRLFAITLRTWWSSFKRIGELCSKHLYLLNCTHRLSAFSSFDWFFGDLSYSTDIDNLRNLGHTYCNPVNYFSFFLNCLPFNTST